jgi:RimJ/RimL family protein N-acetyltransferase
MVELAFLEKELWRLQATVDENFDAGIRYLYALGFYLEGVMKQYGPDKSDHLMMARTVS